MAGSTTDIGAAGELAFVTERFEVAGDRLEVAGHWRGVRARRFVRPVLWLHAGGGRRRLVAVLDHKPWAAEDGEPWVAAFPWGGERLEAERAEMEVGRDVLVELPVPGGTRRKPRPAPARSPGELARAREQLAAAQADVRHARAEIETLRAALAHARDDAERARADGETLVNDEWRQRQAALQSAEETAERLRATEEARALAERQLVAARASYAELEQRLAAAETPPDPDATDPLAAAERPPDPDATDPLAAAERPPDPDTTDPLAAELEAARAERDRLVGELDAARSRAASDDELSSARAELETARTELDAARIDLSSARSERDRLVAELEARDSSGDPDTRRLEAAVESARFDRDRLASELAATRADLETVRNERDRLVVPVGPSRLAPPSEGPELWVTRAVALALVGALLVAVVLLLTGIL